MIILYLVFKATPMDLGLKEYSWTSANISKTLVYLVNSVVLKSAHTVTLGFPTVNLELKKPLGQTSSKKPKPS